MASKSNRSARAAACCTVILLKRAAAPCVVRLPTRTLAIPILASTERGSISNARSNAPSSLLYGFWGLRPVPPGPAAHNEIARVGIDRVFVLDPAAGIAEELNIRASSQAAGDLVLRFREVRAIGVEPVGPEMRAGFGIDQLRVHPNLVTGPPHAAFEDIANAELAADLLYVDRLALVGKSGVAGDHEAAGDPRQIGRQIVGDPVGEIFLVRDRSTGCAKGRTTIDRRGADLASAAAGVARSCYGLNRYSVNFLWAKPTRPRSQCRSRDNTRTRTAAEVLRRLGPMAQRCDFR